MLLVPSSKPVLGRRRRLVRWGLGKTETWHPRLPALDWGKRVLAQVGLLGGEFVLRVKQERREAPCGLNVLPGLQGLSGREGVLDTCDCGEVRQGRQALCVRQYFN